MRGLVMTLYQVGDRRAEWDGTASEDEADANSPHPAVAALLANPEVPDHAVISMCCRCGHVWADTATAPDCPKCE